MDKKNIGNKIEDIEYEIINNGNNLVLCTYSSLPKLKEYIHNFDLIILDECHNSLSPTREFIHKTNIDTI